MLRRTELTLPGGEGRQMGQGESLATLAHPLIQRQSTCRATSDGKPRQENTRRGQRTLDHAKSEDESHTPPSAERVSSQTAQARVHSQEQWQVASFRHSLPARPEHASAVSSRIRPHCGSNGRPKLLWVSGCTIASRCYRAMLYRSEPEEFSAMDTRGGHKVML
jgi:hypothetical protein